MDYAEIGEWASAILKKCKETRLEGSLQSWSEWDGNISLSHFDTKNDAVRRSVITEISKIMDAAFSVTVICDEAHLLLADKDNA